MEAEERLRRPELGTCLAGKYEVEKLLGEGSMGAVYAARNLTTGKRVAIKWLIAERETDFALVDRFRREARAAGRIDHPNVVTIFDVGTHEKACFLVMELLNGEPLSDILMRGRLEPEETIGLMIPVMRGVAAAHASGVVHRDLKPENIFVCRAPDGSLREPKVLDFGISKLVGDAANEELRATRTGVVVGTPTYMSPEQIAGAGEIDSRIDVYALGVMLFEMLAGRPPFMAGTYTALVVQIATATPPDLRKLRPDIDPELVTVIERAMARDRDVRFPDVEELAKALEPFGIGTVFRPEDPVWSIRVGPSRAGSEKFTSTVDGKAPISIRPSAPTLAAETMESGLRVTGAKTAAKPAAAPDVDEPPLARSSAATEDSFRVESPADKRRMVFIGAAIGVILLAIGLVLGLTLGGTDDPAVVDGAPDGSEMAAEPSAVEDGEPRRMEPAQADEAAGEAATAASDPEAMGAEAMAESETAADEGAEDVEASAATEMRAPPRRRRIRRPWRTAMSAMTAAEMTATEMVTMRRDPHRAGTLSVDEF